MAEVREAAVARIRIFPFKSLPGADVAAATLTAAGGLRGDREFALVDDSGVVNAKREPKIHSIAAEYDAALTRAWFTSRLTGADYTFDFDSDPAGLAGWFARQLGRAVTVRRDVDGGFPDDTAAPGPTFVAAATLAAVAAWFEGLDAHAVRLRLRTNVEIGGVPAFWEDRLYAQAGATVGFDVGDARFEGTNPCARCVVPSRDPESGAVVPGFAKRVAAARAASLPPWAAASRFDHYYRLAVNTRTAPGQAGRTLRLGDRVRLASAPAELPAN